MTTKCNTEQLAFQGLGRREVVGRFDGGASIIVIMFSMVKIVKAGKGNQFRRIWDKEKRQE